MNITADTCLNGTGKVSILMVTCNRKEDVEKCVESIFRKPPAQLLEILVLDNASTDGTQEMLAANPNITLICWKRNRGLAPALRHLSDLAKGEWLLFLDSDTLLPADGIDPLIDFAMTNDALGAAAPRMRDLSGQIQMTARRFPNMINSLFGRQTFLSRIWPGNPFTRRFLKIESQETNQPFSCDWVAFAAVLVRRRALDEAGSIDPGFFVYWVDADFFHNVRKAGWEVWCFPAVEVIHMEQNRTDRKRSPKSIRDFHYGAFRYYFKNHGFGGLNPMVWIAALGLSLRAGLHLLINYRR